MIDGGDLVRQALKAARRSGRNAASDRFSHDIRRRLGSTFLDAGEQPVLDRGGRLLLLRVVIGKAAGPEDYGAQLGDAAATRVACGSRLI